MYLILTQQKYDTLGNLSGMIAGGSFYPSSGPPTLPSLKSCEISQVNCYTTETWKFGQYRCTATLFGTVAMELWQWVKFKHSELSWLEIALRPQDRLDMVGNYFAQYVVVPEVSPVLLLSLAVAQRLLRED